MATMEQRRAVKIGFYPVEWRKLWMDGITEYGDVKLKM